MIEISKLTKRFGVHEVLRGVDLDIRRGRITGIVGPNGAGKTTLIKILLGLCHASSGEIRIDGTRVGDDERYRAAIGYMPQIARFPEHLTGAELFTMLRDLRDEPGALDEDLVCQLGLVEQLDKPLGVLSGGTRQKINACAALLFRPRLLILDEPTAGLDPVSSAALKDRLQSLRSRGVTVIVASHVMSELEEICDDVAFLLDGVTRFAGPIATLRAATRQANLERAIAALMIREVA